MEHLYNTYTTHKNQKYSLVITFNILKYSNGPHAPLRIVFQIRRFIIAFKLKIIIIVCFLIYFTTFALGGMRPLN